MADFSVWLTKPATVDLDKISKGHRTQILCDLAKLQSDPLPDGQTKKKLKGFKARIYRLRAGDHRVLYELDGQKVTILRVIDRTDLERILKRTEVVYSLT